MQAQRRATNKVIESTETWSAVDLIPSPASELRPMLPIQSQMGKKELTVSKKQNSKLIHRIKDKQITKVNTEKINL